MSTKVTHSLSQWPMTVLGLTLLCAQPQACRDEAVSHPLANSELVETYLTEDVSNSVHDHLVTVDTQLDALIASIELLRENPEEEDFWEQAQEDWQQTLLKWQPLEVMQVASLGPSMTAVGGQDIRDNVYSWTLTNPCRIDQVTATAEYEGEQFLETVLVSTRGLDALEYLLYAPIETVCPSQVSPVSDGVWASLSAQEIQRQRIEYAHVLVKDVQQQIQLALDEWSVGFPLDQYDSSVEALNAVFDGLLYMEEGVKERKLSYPMGLTEDCSAECTAGVEGKFTNVSTEYILANLDGMESLLFGDQTGGLLEILESVGETELATDLLIVHNETVEHAETLLSTGVSMEVVIKESPNSVEDLLSSVSDYTTLLKWDVATVLQMEIPQSSAGDND